MNDLHDVRTALIVGHYSKVINLAVSKHFGAGVSSLVLWERDFLIAQAQIALQQYDLVLSDLSKRTVEPSLSGSLAAVEALTQYMKARDQGNSQLRVASVARMQQIVAEAPNPGGLTLDYDATICICAATVLINESSVDKAFILLRRAHDTLVPLIGPNSETRLNSIFLRICSLLLESLLRIHRIDMAENILIEMNKLDDDAVSSMLSTVVYNLHAHNYNVGGVETAAQKITEARHILDELISKYGNSVTLLNLSGVVELSRGNYESAERSYLDALDKRSTDIGALIGLCRVSIHLGKPTELIDRYLTQLKATAATHPWVQEYTTLEHQITSA